MVRKPGVVDRHGAQGVHGSLGRSLTWAIFSDGTRGYHSCTFCGEFLPQVKWKRRKFSVHGHGHYLVQLGQVVFMAPALLLHYILEHQYRPPEEFLEAVIKGSSLRP